VSFPSPRRRESPLCAASEQAVFVTLRPNRQPRLSFLGTK
jgi:hypothetical protein